MTADELRVRKAEISTSQLVFYAPVEELSVFCSSLGGMLDQANLRTRVLAPAAAKAGIGKIGLHAIRHTYASMLIAEGRSIVQVQKVMGHDSAASRSRSTRTSSGRRRWPARPGPRLHRAGQGYALMHPAEDHRGAAVTEAAEPAAKLRHDQIEQAPQLHLILVKSAWPSAR